MLFYGSRKYAPRRALCNAFFNGAVYQILSFSRIISDGVGVMSLLPDTQNLGLRMRRWCRERFSHRLQRKPLVSERPIVSVIKLCYKHTIWHAGSSRRYCADVFSLISRLNLLVDEGDFSSSSDSQPYFISSHITLHRPLYLHAKCNCTKVNHAVAINIWCMGGRQRQRRLWWTDCEVVETFVKRYFLYICVFIQISCMGVSSCVPVINFLIWTAVTSGQG